jgi:hypothetical protein
MTSEKFIVKVLRKRISDVENANATSPRKIEEVDQIYEQEFEKIDIGEFAMKLNRKDGQEKDEKSLKMDEKK